MFLYFTATVTWNCTAYPRQTLMKGISEEQKLSIHGDMEAWILKLS